MRGYWGFIKVMVLAVGYSIYTSLAVRLRPKAERPARRAYHQQEGTRLLCRALRFRVSTRGTVPAGEPMLYVCNHLSALDPLILGSQMPVAFAGKAEIRTWPVIGWVCRTHGMLFVDRDRRTSTTTFVQQVQEKLRAGVSVLVFPEGTTGWGDVVQPFKTGAFQAVAGREDGAVLPLFLDVTGLDGAPTERAQGRRAISHNNQGFVAHCLRMLGLNQAEMEVHVGEPVRAAGRSRKELASLTHRAVSALGGLTQIETDAAQEGAPKIATDAG